MTEREQELERKRIATRCVHFNGIQSKACAVAVSYEILTGSFRLALPCLAKLKSDARQTAECKDHRLPTAEEVEKQIADDAAASLRTMLALKAANAHARQLGLGVGKGGSGVVKCPCCADGQIKFSVASVNGHLWAACTTTGCVRWRQ